MKGILGMSLVESFKSLIRSTKTWAIDLYNLVHMTYLYYGSLRYTRSARREALALSLSYLTATILRPTRYQVIKYTGSKKSMKKRWKKLTKTCNCRSKSKRKQKRSRH